MGYGQLFEIGEVDHGPKGKLLQGLFDFGEYFEDRSKLFEYNGYTDKIARSVDFAKYGHITQDTKWP